MCFSIDNRDITIQDKICSNCMQFACVHIYLLCTLHTDPETAVAELEKRVEQLETEKLELIKVILLCPMHSSLFRDLRSSPQSLSAAHLLAAEAPTSSVSQHTRDTSMASELHVL